MAITRPSIGSTEFLLLGQSPDQPGIDFPAFGDRLEDITRPGLDGQAFVNIGKRSDPKTNISCRDFANEAAALAAVLAYELLSGTLQTVTDSSGVAFTNVLVRFVDLRMQKIGTSAGGMSGSTPACLLWGTWEFTRTESLAAP